MNLSTDRNIEAIAEGIGATAKRVALGVAIGSALLALSFCAAAQVPHFVSAGGLSKACKSDTAAGRAACEGFLLGSIDTGNGVHYCLRPGTTLKDVLAPMVKFFANLSEQWAGEPANEIVITILKATSPCPGGVDAPAPRAPHNGGLS